MSSDLKKLLRFTSLQTKILIATIVGFIIIAAFFLFLYTRTEINTQLSIAKSGFSERMTILDNTVLNFSNTVIQIRNMAQFYLEDPGLDRSGMEDGTSFSPHGFDGMLLDPTMDPLRASDEEFRKERFMASRLYAIQHALLYKGSVITRSYYYSKTYRFLSSYPTMSPGRGIDTEKEIQALESYLQLDLPGKHDESFWVGPYFDESLNCYMMTSVIHLYQGNALTGVLGMDIPLESLYGHTEPLFDQKGQFFLICKNGSVMATQGAKPSLNIMELEQVLPPAIKSFSREFLSENTDGFVRKNGYLVLSQISRSSSLGLIYVISSRDFYAYMIPKMRVYVLSIFTAAMFFILGIFIMITRFIKPTRIAELALRKAHAELETRVRERTTELSRINDELKESREKYRQLFTYAPAGIYEIDFISGKFVSVNDVLCEYTGYSKDEFLNFSPFALVTEQGRKILKERLKRVLRGETISRNVELDINTKNGSYFSAVLNNSFIFDGDKITGSRVVIHDISERKIAEKALRKSEERFRNLVETTTDWIWDIDRDGQFVYSSPSVESITGYTPLEIQGKRFVNYFPIYERERLTMILMKNIRPGELLPTIECSIQNKNSEYRTLETRGVHYFDEAGNVLGVRGISRDITEKKRSEEEKAELQKTLDRAKKMEALGLLAGGVAHDLNNILSGIINYPELILLDLPVDSPIRGHVRAIYLSGKKAAAIVDDLITVARGAARKKEIVNINAIIGEFLQSAEYASLAVQYPQVLINVILDKEINNVATSSVQVRKALLNLVINAVESVQGHGSVTITCQNIELVLPIKGYDDIPQGEYVLLSVADTGGGISPEDMDRIFEPFYSKKVMGRSGTGLGLAIVWNTVTEHGGHINVTSGKNGTVFDLYFPATRFRTVEKKETMTLDHVKGKGEKILVVDDEIIQREIATQLLSSLRYSSVALESGEKAVEYLKHDQVDIVLLDMVMEPGMSGRETYEKIIELNPSQKVIITTGYADTKEVRIAQEKGAGEMLKKPYTMEELGTVLSRQLRPGSQM
ncbi:MAG: PAS domain S-box protein [Proteobacteria bacterium]|nr:PAS domain S-box protein [Pseudomonadota bacterium]